MNRRRIAAIFALAAGICILSGCKIPGKQPKEAQIEKTENAKENKGKMEPESQGQEAEEEGIPKEGISQEDNGKEQAEESALDNSIARILNHREPEFIGNYPVDAPFLAWLSKTYGEDSIRGLEAGLAEENPGKEKWIQAVGRSIHVLWTEYCRDNGIPEENQDKIYWKECADENQIVLDFTGDINLAEGWATTSAMDQRGGISSCISDSLLEEMRRADILMINNEFTYSSRGTPLPGKAYTFRAKPERVSVLKELGADVVSLANNHVYDYGEDALVDTLETLEQAGIPYMGAGRNLAEAQKPVYFIANGRKIAIVSATQIERSTNYTREATETSPGVLKTLKPEKFCSVIQNARETSDYVIAFVHWGTEGTNHYGGDQTKLGQAFADAGADVVIGGHTHCLQGFDFLGGKPVIYSLGNFWFNGKTLDTGLSQVVIRTDRDEIAFRFLPCIQKNCKTSLVEDSGERQRILDFMQRISAPGVRVAEDGFVWEDE